MSLALDKGGNEMAASKGKHLNKSTRMIIYSLLIEDKTAREIGLILGLHPTTIMREIKRHRQFFEHSSEGESLCRKCIHYTSCKLLHRCGRRTCFLKCRDCKQLKKQSDCSKFTLFICNVENRFPLVCNGCNRTKRCYKNKYYYDPSKAELEYRTKLVESRRGLNLTAEEYVSINNTIKQGVDKKQSIYHIVKANPETIPVSVKCVYNYINNGKISTKPIDLPRSVSLKKRKKKALSQYEYKENQNIDRSGRRYSDWLVFRAKNRIVTYWEMDFLGAPRNSEQMILVLTIPSISFTLLYPLNRPNMAAVKGIFEMIYSQLGEKLFNKIFEAILTDRDPRFNNFKEIEVDNKTGTIRTRIFFCNPGASNEKPSVENMNQQLRLIFPKGVSLSNISLEQGYLFASNMNARILSSIDDTTPAKLFINIFGKEALDKLNLTLIEPKDVFLNPVRV